MKNLMHEHPSPDVRQAMVRLADALCMWERSTGRENVVIVKDTIGCEYRALTGCPQPPQISDAMLLEAFDNLNEQHNPNKL